MAKIENIGIKVGVQGYHLGKIDFELGVGGEGQDTSRHFEASEQKLGQKQKSELKKIELSYSHYSICQNWMKNYRVMPIIKYEVCAY